MTAQEEHDTFEEALRGAGHRDRQIFALLWTCVVLLVACVAFLGLGYVNSAATNAEITHAIVVNKDNSFRTATSTHHNSQLLEENDRLLKAEDAYLKKILADIDKGN